MKIKLDQITNSSSTAFFFIFKGDKKEQLFDLIRKYKERFNLHHDLYGNEEGVSSNYHFVIDTIEDVLGRENTGYYEKTEIVPIEMLIIKYREDVAFWEKDSKTDPYSKEYFEECGRKLDEIMKAKDAGFTHYLEIEYGDNSGNVTGDSAMCLDYNRDMLNINEEDFILIPECRH